MCQVIYSMSVETAWLVKCLMSYLIAEATVFQVTRLRHPSSVAGFMVKGKNGFSFIQYIKACQLTCKNPKGKQAEPRESYLSQQSFIVTYSQAQVPTTSPVYKDTSIKIVSQNLEFPEACKPSKIQKWQGIRFPSIRNSRNLEPRLTFCGLLFFLPLCPTLEKQENTFLGE